MPFLACSYGRRLIYLYPRSFTMADSSETRVARATKPVSEALLNEKVWPIF